VANEQGGGMNMQTIMESELAYWYSEQSQALVAHTALALLEDPAVSLAQAIDLHQQYPVQGSAEQIHLLRLAGGDLETARAEMNVVLADEHDAWWDMQNITLALLETGGETLSSGQEAALQSIAAGNGLGAIAARAWLAQVQAAPTALDVILPGTDTRSYMGGRGATTEPLPEFLGVYPNPTKGEAYVTWHLPEGATNGDLLVQDATGRAVQRKNLAGSGGIVVLPQNQLPPGVYAVALRADGILVGVVKFIALR